MKQTPSPHPCAKSTRTIAVLVGVMTLGSTFASAQATFMAQLPKLRPVAEATYQPLNDLSPVEVQQYQHYQVAMQPLVAAGITHLRSIPSTLDQSIAALMAPEQDKVVPPERSDPTSKQDTTTQEQHQQEQEQNQPEPAPSIAPPSARPSAPAPPQISVTTNASQQVVVQTIVRTIALEPPAPIALVHEGSSVPLHYPPPPPYISLTGQQNPDVAKRLATLNSIQRTPTVDPNCPQRLRARGVQFTVAQDEVRGYCVVSGTLNVSAFPGVVLLPGQSEMTCGMAERTLDWLQGGVQPGAQRHFNSPVTALTHYSAYSCRRRGGGKISEHGFANALDVAIFQLADGRRFSLEDNWHSDGSAFGDASANFLRDVRASACDEFMVVLDPDSNAAHYNHFHFDAGPWKSCG